MCRISCIFILTTIALSTYGTPIELNTVEEKSDGGESIKVDVCTNVDTGNQSQNKTKVVETKPDVEKPILGLQTLDTTDLTHINTDMKEPKSVIQMQNMTEVIEHTTCVTCHTNEPKLGGNNRKNTEIVDINAELKLSQSMNKAVDFDMKQLTPGLQIQEIIKEVDFGKNEPMLRPQTQSWTEVGAENDPKEPKLSFQIQETTNLVNTEMNDSKLGLRIDPQEPKLDLTKEVETDPRKPTPGIQIQNINGVMDIGIQEPKLETRCPTWGRRSGSPRRRSSPKRRVSPPKYRSKPNLGLETTIGT